MRDTVSWGPGDGDQMAGTDSRIMVRGKPGDKLQTALRRRRQGGLNTEHLDQTQIPGLDPEKFWGSTRRSGEGLARAHCVLADGKRGVGGDPSRATRGPGQRRLSQGDSFSGVNF